MQQQSPKDADTSRDLDRQMLLLSVAFWLVFFVSVVSRAYASGQYTEFGYMVSRIVVASSAAAIAFGLHLILKRLTFKGPTNRFACVVGLSILASILLTTISEACFAQSSPGDWNAHLAMFLSRSDWVYSLTFYSWIFIAWGAVYATVMNAADLRERDRRLAAAERTAQQAQLAALRLQLHPHFLFNSLNALSGLVALGRQSQAEEMIQNLSSFLRCTLTTDPDQMTPLRDEIELQMMYLGIEQTRFSDRLQIECRVPEDCMDALVPSLILQPLVENAIKHALAPTDGVVTVTIGAAHRGNALDFWIKDDGAAAHDPVPGFGIGLKNVGDRLRALFGESAALAAGREGASWISRISIPWTGSTPCAS